MNTSLNGKRRKLEIQIGAALLAVSLAAPVFAAMDCGPNKHWDPAKRSEMYQKRISELHDRLQLTQAQESSWSQFVAKMKPAERHEKHERADKTALTAPERMDRRIAFEQQKLQKMQARTQAVKEFYAQLTPDQQKTFDESLHHRKEHHPGAGHADESNG